MLCQHTADRPEKVVDNRDAGKFARGSDPFASSNDTYYYIAYGISPPTKMRVWRHVDSVVCKCDSLTGRVLYKV